MALSKDAPKRKDYPKPILNTRLKYLDENKSKIKGKSGFLYCGYHNEKDRIKDAIEYNKVLFSSIHLDTPIRSQSQNTNAKENNQKYFQPEMKFRPRNDLERIREGVNLNYYGKVESELIRNQLLEIKNKARRRFYNYNSKSKDATSTEEAEKQKENEYVIIPQPKKKEVTSKNYIQIIPKANFGQSRGYKTHFKATESIAIRNKQLDYSSIYHKNQSDVNHHPFYNSLNGSNNNNNNNNNEDLKVFDFEDKASSLSYNTRPLLWSQSQDSIYHMNRNPYRKRDLFPDESNADMSLLKTIAFTQRKEEEQSASKQHHHHDDLKFEKKISIGNEEYGVRSQLNLIAEKVLNKCNIYNKRNNDPNSTSYHESKNGKLMMTSGLSIKEFLLKYHLPG